MNLSIIIVNYRSWDCLSECLDGLGKGEGENPWEIIVVDNQSGDGRLAEFVERYPRVRFLENERNGGFSYGCNRGARLATGETLLFMNPDVVANSESIRKLLGIKLAHPEIAILTARQVNGKGRVAKSFDVFPDKLTWFKWAKSLQRKLQPGRFPDPRRAFPGLLQCDWVSGSVLMIGREAFDHLGGWREDYWMYLEDCDICLRAKIAGLPSACTGDVQVIHHHGGASRRDFETSVLTRTESIVSKHLYNHLNNRGFNRFINHLCIFSASVPRLSVMSILDLLTYRQVVVFKTRTRVLGGLMRHYMRVLRSRDWRSSQVTAGA
jgi:GT2 family glycosyltransferase